MPYRMVYFIQGAIYHVYNRGARKSPIFHASEDYEYLLHLLQSHAARCQIVILAYCFMPDHYHILLRQDGYISVSQFMARVFTRYSTWFNAKYGMSGTLFEGRFKAVYIDSDFYHPFLCGFIHLNPEKADLVSDPWEWPYSNCRQWVEGNGLTPSELEFIQDTFGTGEDYRKFLIAFPEIAAGFSDDILGYLLD
jgi:REP element-mobilizing transposase RayT